MRFLLYFLLSFCFGFLATAQEFTDEEPLYARIGFKGGLNYTNIAGDTDSPGSRVRLHLGVVGEYPVTPIFFIQGELLYSAQGYTLDESEEEKIGLNYIALPLLAKYYFTPNISFATGPQFALLSTSSSSRELENNDPFYTSFREFDFGWSAGAGYWLEQGLFFQARFTMGLSNINTGEQTNRNVVAQLSVGYLFPTKKNRRIFQDQ